MLDIKYNQTIANGGDDQDGEDGEDKMNQWNYRMIQRM